MSTTCFVETWFFTFFCTWITCHESFCFKSRFEFFIPFYKSTSNTMSYSTGLSSRTTTRASKYQRQACHPLRKAALLTVTVNVLDTAPAQRGMRRELTYVCTSVPATSVTDTMLSGLDGAAARGPSSPRSMSMMRS